MSTFPVRFELPDELIAQTPVAGRRDESRLLVFARNKEHLTHRTFSDITEYLQAGDLLVFNNSKVIPARLFGQKETGGIVEIFLLRPLPINANHSDEQSKNITQSWEAMLRWRGARPGMRCQMIDSAEQPVEGFFVELIEKASEKTWNITVTYTPPHQSMNTTRDALASAAMPDLTIEELIDRYGHMPIPPYISRSGMSEAELRDRYQTVYASLPGSAAAPTAGLHFTPELLASLDALGVERAEVTLHVGLGTFASVTAESLDSHVMHSEQIEITPHAAEQINRAKAEGRRVIAVGTTSVRVLESLADKNRVRVGSMSTQIFIRPGYQFQIIDGLITNFHIPESTLLLLVSAFAGTNTTQHAYDTAITEKYRFYSFGDAMLIL